MLKLTKEQMGELRIIMEPYITDVLGNDKFAYYEGLPPEVMDDLIDRGLTDPEESQNSSPTIDFFMGWCYGNPGYTMHGYLVLDEDRDDNRISVEGVEGNDFDIRDINEILEFRFADQFDIDIERKHFYCWYD